MEELLEIFREIKTSQQAILEKLFDLDRKHRVINVKLHETNVNVKKGLEECKKMLKCVQKSYHNVLEAQEYCLNETEENISDLSNCVSNLNWMS